MIYFWKELRGTSWPTSQHILKGPRRTIMISCLIRNKQKKKGVNQASLKLRRSNKQKKETTEKKKTSL
jgi:hypothetical protein